MSKTKATQKLRIGMIGCGGRGAGLAKLAAGLDKGVQIAAIADPDVERVRRLVGDAFPLEGVRMVSDHTQLLEHADELDGLIIASRCHQHTPMALQAAAVNLPIYLEKPVAVDHEQLAALWQALGKRDAQIVVSFPLRLTPVFEYALAIVRSGRLGQINQVQAFNNVPYGGHYYGGHYRNFEESHGLWLQKATHDFDYINVLLKPARPTALAATRSQLIYTGDMPHELTCSRCNRTRECMESPENIRHRGDPGGMVWDGINPDDPNDHFCAFSRDLHNQDAGSALLLYDNGAHANYTQNFVTRRSAGRRGATITGYKGTLDFDFHGAVRVVEHHRDIVEKVEVKATGGHGGGDAVLMENFLAIIRGEAESLSPLSAGVLSASMSLAAHESAAALTFRTISPEW